MPRQQASRVLDRYELSQATLQLFEQLSGGGVRPLPAHRL
jgi:hypothetical protein